VVVICDPLRYQLDQKNIVKFVIVVDDDDDDDDGDDVV